MLRAPQKNHKGRLARGDLLGGALAGITEVAFLVACANHTLTDAEVDELARMIALLLDQEPREGEIVVLLEACREALEVEGYDARLNAILRQLPTPAQRRVALELGAEVLLADDTFRLEHDGEFFVALGLSLGFSHEEVIARLREALQRASSPG
jgi:hypothetical protein